MSQSLARRKGECGPCPTQSTDLSISCHCLSAAISNNIAISHAETGQTRMIMWAFLLWSSSVAMFSTHCLGEAAAISARDDPPLNITCQHGGATNVSLSAMEDVIDWYCDEDPVAVCGMSYDAHQSQIFLVWQVIVPQVDGTCHNCSTMFRELTFQCGCSSPLQEMSLLTPPPRSNGRRYHPRKCHGVRPVVRLLCVSGGEFVPNPCRRRRLPSVKRQCLLRHHSGAGNK